MIKIDSVGDYFHQSPKGMCHWIILGREYYPLVDEEMDGVEFIEFHGLGVQSQKRIFALCVEGWL